MEFALKSEIYCFIHLHSLLRIVFVHNIYYIFAKLSLANIRPRFSNKPIVHSRHQGRCTQKFKNNHFTFLKNTELRLFNRKESQSNSPVQLSSPAVQSNCPVQLSSPVQSSPVQSSPVQSSPVQSSPCFVLCPHKWIIKHVATAFQHRIFSRLPVYILLRTRHVVSSYYENVFREFRSKQSDTHIFVLNRNLKFDPRFSSAEYLYCNGNCAHGFK